MRRHLPLAALLLLLLLPAPPYDVLPPFGRSQPLAVGIHAPNRDWNTQDYVRMTHGEFDSVKMMSYHPVSSYARLRQILPEVQFFVRLNTPWIELPDPSQFVAANVPHLRALVDAGYAPWVEVGNEPNLELHPQAQAAFASWYLDVLRGLRAEVPQAKYGFPGLARDLHESDWLLANAAAIGESDWLGVHAYWLSDREMLDPRGGLRLLDYHRRYPRLPLVVTEAGSHQEGITTAERGRQYARFVRILGRLPYVRAVHFFLLSGSAEWRRFFFDEIMIRDVRDAGRDPVPAISRLFGFREVRRIVHPPSAALESASPTPLPSPTVAHAGATPTPQPLARRRLLVDATPAAATTLPWPQGRWRALPAATAPAASLRSISGFTASDFSARLAIAPPSPGEPLALQIAESDLFAGVRGAQSASATGFALLWDGARWRLQYRRAGMLTIDAPLAEGPSSSAGWLHMELALEPRSAAAWIWPRGQRQPELPSVVFAPPEVAALDGARPRALFLPNHPLSDVVLEGVTRFS